MDPNQVCLLLKKAETDRKTYEKILDLMKSLESVKKILSEAMPDEKCMFIAV